MNQELISLNIERYLHLLSGVIAADPSDLSTEWLRVHKWAAVPVEDPITEIDAEWIANAANCLEIETAIGISTKPESNLNCFEVPMTQAGILEYQYRVMRFIPDSFLLIPKVRKFAILHEGDYYFVIAGPYDFVRTAAGCSLRTARIIFRERYAKDFYNKKTTRFLLDVAERYEPFGGEMPSTINQVEGFTGDVETEAPGGAIIVANSEQYQNLLSDLVEAKVNFNLEWLRAHHWVAVPLSAPINEMTAEWLAEAVGTMTVKKCIGVSTDPEATPDCLEVPMTQSALLDFEKRVCGSPYLLLPEDSSFAILHGGKLFLVIAGPRSFVRTAVGCSFPTAFTIFRDRLMATEFDTEEEEAIIEETAARYEPLAVDDAGG